MERPQMIHMACEGILIGGLSLYFTKQIKQQAKEIEELKSVIAKNQAANEKRFEVLFNFLDNVNGGFMPSKQQSSPPQKVKKALPQKEEEIKRLPQKKKTVVKTVEEPSVLTIKKQEEPSVCDPNDLECTDDIQDELRSLEEEPELLEESIETDME